MDLNKITLIGNLTRDPEERTLPSGQTFATFGIATNLVWRDAKTHDRREAAEFHTVVAWGALSKTVMQFLQKGSRVYVEGRLRQRSWVDKHNQRRSAQEVSLSELIMLGGYRREREPADELSVEEVPAEDIETPAE